MKRMKEFIKSWADPFLFAISAFCLFRLVLILGYVPSGSMEPTLKTGSLIQGLRIYPEPEIGDIGIFQYDGTLMVKRIAAVGGDQIEHNGEAVTVPDGCCYMLGDNASDSFDSRFLDEPFVSEENIIARMLFSQ